MIVPQTMKSTPNGDYHMDIYSHLLDERIIMLDGPVDDASASIIKAQLMYLDAKDPDKDIHLYVNSPGGSVSAGMGIIDVMNLVHADVSTIATGMAASMGSLILACGAKGKRYTLKHSEVMIHQPLGGAQGQATDIQIAARHIERTKNVIAKMYEDATGRAMDDIMKDIERDNWLDAQEAVDYGIVDAILE